MSINCVKQCKVGDVIHVGDSYLVTQSYVHDFHRDAKTKGYLLLREITSSRNTFIAGQHLMAITKIIKAKPNENLSPKL